MANDEYLVSAGVRDHLDQFIKVLKAIDRIVIIWPRARRVGACLKTYVFLLRFGAG